MGKCPAQLFCISDCLREYIATAATQKAVAILTAKFELEKQEAVKEAKIITLKQIVNASKNINCDGYVSYSFFLGLECRIVDLEKNLKVLKRGEG